MKSNKKNQDQDPEVVIESVISKSEQFIEKQGKKLLIALIVIVLCVGGYFGYQHLWKAPEMDTASAAMFDAQHEFERGSFDTALNGNGTFEGFAQIASKYGSLPQGNIATHYAGICCLYLGDFQKAVEYFKAFESVDGAAGELITAQNLGLTGDAYIELGNKEEGVKMYEKAAAHSSNADTAPIYLKKAAMVNDALGNYTKAMEQYNAIKYNYPQNMIARDIDKYIAMIEQKI